MSIHILAGFKRQARQGEPTIIYVGGDLVEGLRIASAKASEFQSFGRLSNPLWIPATVKANASSTLKTEQSNQKIKGKV